MRISVSGVAILGTLFVTLMPALAKSECPKKPLSARVTCLEGNISDLRRDLNKLIAAQQDLGVVKLKSTTVGDACIAVNGGSVFATTCTDGVQNRLWQIIPTKP
jgi:hypothetical protein